MAKSRRANQRPYYNLFLKMTLILFVPLLIVLMCFSYALKQMVLTDYETMNRQLIDRVSYGIDQSVTAQISMAYSLSGLSSLRELSANLLEDTIEVQQAYKELRNILRFNTYNDLTETIAVYFPARSCVISTGGSASHPADFYRQLIGYDDLTADQFYARVESTRHHAYLPLASASPRIKAHGGIVTYIQPIDQGYLQARAYYLVVITEEALTRRVLDSFESDVQFQLFDAEGTHLYSSGGVPSAADDSYRVFYPEALSCGLRLVFYVPESAVMRSISRFVVICAAAIGVCLCVGLLLARRLTWQLYVPYRELLSTSFPEGLQAENRSMHEGFRLIADRVLETQQANSRFQQELQSYFSAARDNALLHLMIRCAYLSDEELAEAAELCKLPVDHCSYQVALFKAPSGDFSLPDAASSPDGDCVLRVCRLSARQFVAIAALSSADAPNPLPPLVSEYGERFRIGLSRVHAGIRDLSRCLSEADSACHRPVSSPLAEPAYSIEKELQLIAAARDGLFPDVRRLLTEIHEENRAAFPEDGQAEAALLNRFCVTAHKAIEQMPEALQESLQTDAARLSESELVGEERFLEILGFYEHLCGATSSDIHRKNQAIIENVRTYLNERYADPTLCLDSVAEHLGVSYYFLSRIFKSETSQSFSDLLNDTRVRRAMELLRTTNIPVQDVCVQVGYTNWSTFLRAFRKRAGTTPLQYRNRFAG